ncbi:hypothetical protein OEB99_16730 [Actinotalea sp. M2MS4P-6]|uniref:hypothetical protein n=1 Tax=Actinotalea sp. M2MS4P-6 TaxID=2983762 RepID=UPI0021E4B888|nr:hypothetical protein [Actinotalea sp. M2MS4P-6]MCV2395963.1 hypothetical protein [Actinotalea sp. M2MS4P-6]
MTALAVRSAASLSDANLRASAMGRVSAAAEKYGHDSPQVAQALARWARIDAARVEPDDLTALVEALGVSGHLLSNARAEREHRDGVTP